MAHTLPQLRTQIDALDRELLALLNRRAGLALEVGEIKRAEGSAVFRPDREAQVIAGLQGANPGPLKPPHIAVIWREVMSACRSLEAYERVGRVRLRWRRVAGPSASLAANHAVARGVSQLRRLVTPPPKARVRKAGDETSVRKAGEETKGQQRKGKKAEDGWELEDEWESDDKEGGALPAASRDDVPTPSTTRPEAAIAAPSARSSSG
jgi:chorismate mutase-like protein